MNQTPLIRVSRKRNADPHEALIVQIKRIKQVNPVVFTYYKTADPINCKEQDLDGVHIVDLPDLSEKHELDEKKENRMENDYESSSNPLEFVNDEAIGEIGSHQKQNVSSTNDQVMLNGRLMVQAPSTLNSQYNGNDLVFDYYRVNSQNDRNVEFYSNQFMGTNLITEDTFDVRFASRYEAELVDHDSDNDSNDQADDHDDSNDEDNWRNDYPDEDSYEENSDNDDNYYGELRAEEWHDDEKPFPENIQRQFEHFAINDRYESFFEGDDTSDDEH